MKFWASRIQREQIIEAMLINSFWSLIHSKEWRVFCWIRYGCFQKWWYPISHPKFWSFLVGKPHACWGNPAFSETPMYSPLHWFLWEFGNQPLQWHVDFKKSDYLIYTGDFTSFTLPWKCFYNPLISLIRKPKKKKKTWKVRPGMTFHG